MEKREFLYIAPSISIVDMHFESAVLNLSGGDGKCTNSNTGDDIFITFDD